MIGRLGLVAFALLAIGAPAAARAQGATCAYVACYGSGTVAAIDALATMVPVTIPIGCCPTTIAVSPDGRTLYVGMYFGSVSVVDTATNRVRARISVGYDRVSQLAVGPDGASVYATTLHRFARPVRDLGHIAVIDAATTTVRHWLSGESFALSPDGDALYVETGCGGHSFGSPCSQTISIVDTATYTMHATAGVGGRVAGLSPDGQTLYLLSETAGQAELLALDTTREQIQGRASLPGWLGAFAVSPNGQRVYVASQVGAEAISVIDAQSLAFVESIPLAVSSRLALAPDGLVGYVTSAADNTVSVVDLLERTVTATVTVWGSRGGEVVAATVPGGCSAPTCEGDCDGDGYVRIHELVTAVAIGLRGAPLAECPAFPRATNLPLSVDALLRAVRNGLLGCAG